MSVMQRRDLQELAFQLADLLQFQIPENTNPLEPGIILSALAVLFPDYEQELQQILQLEGVEQQWSCVLEFIEINMLDGQRFDLESLAIQEIAEIYQLVIQFTEHAINQDGTFEQEEPQNVKKNEKMPPNKDKPKKDKQISKEKQIKQQKTSSKGKPNKDIQVKKHKERPQQKHEGSSKERSESKNKNKERSNSGNKANQKRPQTTKQNPKKTSQKISPIKPTKAVNVPMEPLQNELIRQITTAMKANNKKPKNKVLLKDPKSTEQVMKAKRQFEHYINQFKKQGKKKIQTQNKLKKSGLDQYFLKALQRRQKNIQQTVINEQLKYFLTLRDKKVAFINKIHSLTQKLERQRLVQKQKQQRKLMQQQREKTRTKIMQSNALFEKNMWLLKQNYKAIRQKNELQEYNQRAVCKEMEQVMKQKKLSQLQDLKMLWQQQNMKLNNIMGDQQKIKNKLIDIYRKNRP